MVMEVENPNTVEKWDIRNCNKEKEASVAFRVLKPNKLNGRGYKQMLKLKGRKFKGSDVSIEKKSRMSQNEVNVTESNGTKNDEKADDDNSVSHSRRERLDFLLRRVKIDSQVKQSNGSNLPIQTESTKPNFVEYWVPVGLSEMQTEQYCGTLFSKADILCSCDATEILNETLVSMLVSTKKCCDHPYLVDGSLCTSLIRDIPKPELLDAEIKLSNKLLLLHKVLLEIKKRGLRVLILYQSLGGSQSFSLGDILDEFIQLTLGTDIYVHIAGRLRVSRSKRRVTLKSFNDKVNMKFVCLMETRSCIPSVTLSSIDTVISFNSDWNPINDLKALQRIELDSRFQDLNVFRFYSAHTLEEKVLILAKQGRPLEGNNILSDIKQSTCHQLLTWGANYLFEKLDEFHDNISKDNDLENVFVELSSLLPDSEENSNSTVCGNKSSFIVKAQQIDGIYPRNIFLRGELERESLVDNISLVEIRKMALKDPHVFWTELLEKRSPRWKYFSSRSRRARKIVQRFEELLEPASKKRRREVKSAFYPVPTNVRRKTRSKVRNRDRRRKLVPQRRVANRREPISSINEPREESSAIIVQSVCKALEIELEGLQKQKTELLKLHEEKKLRIKMECENEIDRIRKKYDTVLENAETGFMEEKGVIEVKYNKVYVNKSLAEAVISAENTTLSQVTSDCSVEEMYQLFLQLTRSKTATRPEQVAVNLPNQERLASRSDQHPGNLFPTFPNLVPSSEVARCRTIGQSGPNQPLSNLENIGPSINLASSVQIPQTLVSSMAVVPFGFSGNVPASYSVWAPPPHLRHMRPPQPVTAPKMSSPGPEIFSPVRLRPVTSNFLKDASHVETVKSSLKFFKSMRA
ncbi:helicase protein mom1 [Phtheirospermum japonicum]|uniref:Helicase protein mom1 n=1 Tax=Phtheirospermum japonicum TaxID=374723 RepID=A0A830BGZ5_9LAMI|nr:helicase protein mom1 [Phtheirospermum japonicum]